MRVPPFRVCVVALGKNGTRGDADPNESHRHRHETARSTKEMARRNKDRRYDLVIIGRGNRSMLPS